MIAKIEKGGKITIPVEYMEELRLEDGIKVEISVQDGGIVIKRLRLSYTFCNSVHKLFRMGNLCACRKCINRLYEAEESNYLYPIWR
jgi:bifunctional DNA-binding transcriptional regulator/antitoxin component of YhaV-PrlF toxin-antitoxin module